MIRTCYAHLRLIVASSCLLWGSWAVAGDAPDAPGSKNRHDVDAVVLTKSTGLFTHNAYIEPGTSILLKVNVKDGISTEFLSQVTLKPDHLLIPRTLADGVNFYATTLYPDVLKFGERGNDDFVIDALWKKLLGQSLTLVVEQDGMTIAAKAALAGTNTAKLSAAGNVMMDTKSRRTILGKLLGVGQDSAGAGVLKLLGEQDNEIQQVAMAGIVSIGLPDEVARDVQRAVDVLSAIYRVDKRTLRIQRVVDPDADNLQPATANDTPPCNSEVTYEHALSNAWTVRLDGQAVQSKEGTMQITAWAQIWNETPYDWNDVHVTLTTDKAEYIVKKISLLSGQTSRFPIDNVQRVPVRVQERYELMTPVVDGDATIQRTLVLINEGDSTIPAGNLVISNSTTVQDLPHIMEVGELAAGTPGRLNIPLETKAPLSVVVKRKTEVPIRSSRIRGAKLEYDIGQLSTYTFKRTDETYSKVHLTIFTGEDKKDDLHIDLVDNAGSSGQVLELELHRLLTPGRELLPAMKDPKDGKTVRLFERSVSGSARSLNLFETPRSGLAEISSVTGPHEVREELQATFRQKGDIEQIRQRLSELDEQLRDLETDRQNRAAQASSQYHGAILRRLADRIHDKEAEILQVRNELAQTEYAFSAYLSQLNVPSADSSTAIGSRIRELGGFVEVEDDRLVLISFGGGFPANQIQDRDLAELGDLSAVEYLSLRGCENITGQGLNKLAGASNVAWLILGDTNVDDQGLQYLQSLGRLRLLDLSRTAVTHNGLQHLAKLDELESLSLSGTSIGGDGLHILKELRGLKSLDLDRTNITGELLVHLKDLARLEELSLRGTSVVDADLMHLNSLRTMRVLRLDGTKVTPSGRGTLEKMLPKCRITHDRETVELLPPPLP